MTKVINLRAMVFFLCGFLLLLVLVNSISSTFSADSVSIPWLPVPASKGPGYVNPGIETPQPVEVGGFSLEDGMTYEEVGEGGFELMKDSLPMESLQPPRMTPQVFIHDWGGLTEDISILKEMAAEQSPNAVAAQSILEGFLQLENDLNNFLEENEGSYENLLPFQERFFLLKTLYDIVRKGDMSNSTRVLAHPHRGFKFNLNLLNKAVEEAEKPQINYYEYTRLVLILRFNVFLPADDTIMKPNLYRVIKMLPQWQEKGVAGRDVLSIISIQDWSCNPGEVSKALKSLGYNLE